LATENLSGPEADQLRDKAGRLRDQMDTLAPPGIKQLPAKQESLTLAQLRQMENELEALRSSVLQLKKERVGEHRLGRREPFAGGSEPSQGSEGEKT